MLLFKELQVYTSMLNAISFDIGLGFTLVFRFINDCLPRHSKCNILTNEDSIASSTSIISSGDTKSYSICGDISNMQLYSKEKVGNKTVEVKNGGKEVKQNCT